jgi:hypothetical protein
VGGEREEGRVRGARFGDGGSGCRSKVRVEVKVKVEVVGLLTGLLRKFA